MQSPNSDVRLACLCPSFAKTDLVMNIIEQTPVSFIKEKDLFSYVLLLMAVFFKQRVCSQCYAVIYRGGHISGWTYIGVDIYRGGHISGWTYIGVDIYRGG